MIYLSKEELPSDFSPARFGAVGCFVENEGQILLLLRQVNTSHGGTWGLPSGKVDAGETIQEAMLREIQEETGIVIVEKCCRFLQTVYVRFEDEYDFVYHLFSAVLEERPEVCLNPNEHQRYQWVSPEEALARHQQRGNYLIKELDACIELYYK